MRRYAYKLLTPQLTTHNNCQWTVGEWKRTSGKGELCGPGWLHCYDSAEIAPFLNPIHANVQDPVLYRVEVAGKRKTDCGLKTGYTKMRLVRQQTAPTVTRERSVRFALCCALSVYHDPQFRIWAERWVSGIDRTASAASAWAAWAAEARAAAWAAWASAAWAANRSFSLLAAARWALSDKPLPKSLC